jgi:hypothetical protein
VIEMDNDEDNTQFRAQFEQDTQQRDGVGSAGDGDGNTVARVQQIPFPNVMQDLVTHRKIVKLSPISRQLLTQELQSAADSQISADQIRSLRT